MRYLSALWRIIFSEFHELVKGFKGFKALTTWKCLAVWYFFNIIFIGFCFALFWGHYILSPVSFASSGRKKKKKVSYVVRVRTVLLRTVLHWPPGSSEISSYNINSLIYYNHATISVRLNGLYTCFVSSSLSHSSLCNSHWLLFFLAPFLFVSYHSVVGISGSYLRILRKDDSV